MNRPRDPLIKSSWRKCRKHGITEHRLYTAEANCINWRCIECIRDYDRRKREEGRPRPRTLQLEPSAPAPACTSCFIELSVAEPGPLCKECS